MGKRRTFYVDADHLPKGGEDTSRRIMIKDGHTSIMLLKLHPEEKSGARTAGGHPHRWRINLGPYGEIFLMDKIEGCIRHLTR